MRIAKQKVIAKKISEIALEVFAILLPSLFLLLCICVWLQYSLWSYVPKGGDGLGYWAQIAAFTKAGFHSGYFCWAELIAPISYFHFSVHGPGFTIVYGMLGKLVGWHWYSPPIFNNAFLIAALTFLAVLGSRSQKNWGLKLLFLSVLIITTWSILIYFISPLQEAFHIAIGIAIGGLLAHYLLSNSPSKSLFFALLLTITLASFIRPTWSFLFFPIAMIASSRLELKKRSLILFLGLAAPLLFFLVWRQMSAPLPYGYGPLDWIKVYIERRLQGAAPPRFITDQIWEFTRRLFDIKRLQEQTLFFIFVWQTILYLVFCIGLNWKQLRADHFDKNTKINLTIIWLLAVNLINAIYIYQVEPDAQARLLAAPLFLAMVLHLFSGQKQNLWLLGGLLLSNLLITPWGMQSLHSAIDDGWSPIHMNQFIQLRTELANLIPYDASKSGWCNTILISDYDGNVIAYPPGIGLAWTPHTQWISHPRARYALVNETIFKALAQLSNYRFIAKTSLGNLYENLSADCTS